MKKFVLILYLFTGIAANNCESKTDNNSVPLQIFDIMNSENHADDCCEKFCLCKCCKTTQMLAGHAIGIIRIFIADPVFITSTDLLIETYSDHWQPPNPFLS